MVETKPAITLTEVTAWGRQGVKWSIIAVIAMMVGRLFFTSLVAFWKAAHPPAPPPPTVGFGILPKIKFPEVQNKPKSYSLEIAQSKIPEFSDRAKVFLMLKSTPNLLSDEKAKKIAASLGFLFSPEVLNNRTYRFSKTKPLESTLTIDTQNFNFSLSTDYLGHSELLNKERPLDTYGAVTQVKNFLTSTDLLPADMATSSADVTLSKIAGNGLVDALSLSDSDYIKVDLNRYPIDGAYRMYTSKGYQGIVHAVVGGNLSGSDSVVEIENHYHPLDYTQVHTYPLRSVNEAWKILQAGEGFVAQAGSSETAVIRKVSLGYFDSFEEQDYLQPVYVFEGDNDFLGLVPAISTQYLQS